MAREPSQRGARLGQVLSAILTRKDLAVEAKAAPARVELGIKGAEMFFSRAEKLVAPLVEELFKTASDDPNVPAEARPLVDAIAQQKGGIFGYVFSTAIGIGIGAVIGPVLEPLVDELRDAMWAAHPGVELTPEQAAAAVIRGVLTEEQGAGEARRAGVNEERFHQMTLLAGGPPGIQELLFAYRRGKIDRERLIHGIRQSALRDEWIDVIEDLRFVPPSTEAAITAAVQGFLPEERMFEIAETNGIAREDARWLFETAGDPPAPGQILELLNRGEIPQPKAEALLRETRIKNEFIPLVLKLREYLPPVRTVVAMHRNQGIGRDEAITLLRKNGVAPDIAEAMLTEGENERLADERDLTKSEIARSVTDRLIDHATGVEMLQDLGYDQHEAELILELAEIARLRRFRDAVVNRIRSLFLARRIDENAASLLLDAQLVRSEARDEYLTLWTIERDLNLPVPTVAQIGAALKAGLLTDDEALAELVGRGYSDRDASLILSLATKRGVGIYAAATGG